MSSPTLSRRERQKAERKQRIFDAAIKVFAEKGFRNATVKDIAEVADVGEGTIYSYYASKDDLLMSIFDQLGELKLQSAFAAEGWEVEPKEWFYRLIVENTERFRGAPSTMYLAALPELLNNPELRKRFYTEGFLPAFARMEAYIAERIKHGDMRALDVQMVVRIMTSVSLGSQILMLMGDPLLLEVLQVPERFARTFVEILFDGIGKDQE